MGQAEEASSAPYPELDITIVKDDLVRGIRDIYNEYNEKTFGTIKGEGFYTRHDWCRIDYVFSDLVQRGGSILDVGVGAGQLLHTYNKSGAFTKIAGADIVRHTRFYDPEDELRVYFMDVSQLLFADNSFDVVTCMEVLEHIPEASFIKALKQLRRVAKKQLIMTVPFNEPEPLPSFHLQRFDEEKIERYFPDAKKLIMYKYKRAGVPWLVLQEFFDS